MAPRSSADAIPEPSAAWVDLGARVLEPWRRLEDPVCFGVDRVPRPTRLARGSRGPARGPRRGRRRVPS
jgi:hypothetical protein